LKEATDEYQVPTGAGVAEWRARDTSHEKIIHMMRAHMAFSDLMEKNDVSANLPEPIQELIGNAKSCIDDVATAAIEENKSALQRLMAALALGARGGQDGEHWSSGCEQQDNLDLLLETAKGSILTKSANEFKSQAEDVQAHVADLKHVRGIFKDTSEACSKLLEDAHTFGGTLWLSHCEGLLCALFMSSDVDMKSMKAKCHAVKKLMASRVGCRWEGVHASLASRVARAVKMQS